MKIQIDSLYSYDYHGEFTKFVPGDRINHVTDGGEAYQGTVQEITSDGSFSIAFDDGDEGTEKPETCFKI